MDKPKNKADWIKAAKKRGVLVEKADTVKEIQKNIADKLEVSARGKNFLNRLLVAMEKSKPSVSPSNKKVSTPTPVASGNVKLKFDKVIHERELDVYLQFKGIDAWFNKNQIEMVSDSEVIMPDWLAELNRIS